MSCRENQDFAGAIIDSPRFAAEHGCISGKLVLSSLSRLSDMLSNRDGLLECEVKGGLLEGPWGAKPALHLRVEGRVVLRCQRCLADMEINLDIRRQFLLWPDDVEWPEDELESEEYDAIPADRELSLAELVEEEVLLALPIVPRHADCALPVGSAGSVAVEEESVASPFAVLSRLKKH